jgi:hypothetical protein
LRLSIEIAGSSPHSREAELRFAADEVVNVHLHLAFPEKRNRTGLYMRRHAHGPDEPVGPNQPLRATEEPPKLSIPEHVAQMARQGRIQLAAPSPARPQGSELFAGSPEERAMIAVPISDLVANLLRPCFHRDGWGGPRLFYLHEEPIVSRTYFCLCCFAEKSEHGQGRLAFRRVRFDREGDWALDVGGGNLVDEGLVWAAAVVPLVVEGRALPILQIAQANYDLRQIVGRHNESPIRHAYEGWFDQWDARVEKAVTAHQRIGRPFETFYHSVLGVDATGNILVRQKEAALPELASSLASEGIVAAGLLDSGGSPAIYDVWSASYLNHGWYHRQPRGAILLFELGWVRRLPEHRPDSWVCRRAQVEKAAGRQLDTRGVK